MLVGIINQKWDLEELKKTRDFHITLIFLELMEIKFRMLLSFPTYCLMEIKLEVKKCEIMYKIEH